MKNFFEDKTILLTGGTGSFGNMLTELILKEHKPKSLRVYSRGELKQVDMERKFNDDRLRFFVGDMRDKERLMRAMNGADYVVHAAALKHVPVCEYNPAEAVKTNIHGAMNLVECAIDSGVKRVLALSTDKAAQPVNLYGATKLVMEKIITQGNVYRGEKGTQFSCVRYGNVIGSSGSVIPLFLKQKEKGEITITDERMTRFWITLEQGARFVMQSMKDMHGGEVFVPKIPSVKVTDISDVVAPGVKRKTIGIRPGEKLHEVLVTYDESRHAHEYDGSYIIFPEHRFWSPDSDSRGKALPEGFVFSSDRNEWRLKGDELKKLLEQQGLM